VADVLDRAQSLLFEAFGAKAIYLYRLDVERLRVERSQGGVEELSPAEFSELATWCHGAQTFRGDTKTASRVLAALLPKGTKGAILAGPLAVLGEPLGILVAVCERKEATAAQETALRSVLEPISVSLEHDRRMNELTRLREAMEADKRALLQRLDRQDISESVIGAETGLREVIERVEQVARTDAPVLILGETGSGKEVVARAIHTRSHRAQGPMVRVNCGAIPSELIDSELFGHERGSFTGAVAARRGWFERADGGVLFLDEIGELPLAAQVRLLRVLQDGIIERVGAQRPVNVDVRIVAATHRDLHAMVENGTFRQDLWYRISVFPIRLPPLRERLQDIPSLAAHFAQRAAKRLGVSALSLRSEDISQLVSYDWPGNVRELAAVIERATILGEGKRLAVAEALGAGARPHPQNIPHRGMTPASPADRGASGNAANVEAALVRSHGRIEGPFGAAAALGINPHTLRSRMRKMGIDWKEYRGK
jgi:transcriptional regulator with GAF, ATPase, and Fis domain